MTPNRLKALELSRIDVLCGFLFYELGQASLRYAPLLVSGFRCAALAKQLRGREAALVALRRCCRGLSTLAALRAAAVRYNDAGMSGTARVLFEIDEKRLTFKPLYDALSPSLKVALEELNSSREPARHNLKTAPTAKPIQIEVKHDGEVKRFPVKLPPSLPAWARHVEPAAPDAVNRAPIHVLWADLLAEADAMDDIDRESQAKRPGNWGQRLRACELVSPRDDGQFPLALKLELVGRKHLIGLPGAGKTTLLVCLLRHLARRGVRVAVFFPSIEVCRQYLEELRSYGVSAGLLVGQSQETRVRHAKRLAETLAADDRLKGFGKTSSSAPLFEGICPLPALTDAPAEVFRLSDHYCHNVLTPGSKTPQLCPAWGLCSYNKAPRELPEASVWLGHVLSADTQVPAQTTNFDERYYSLIARSFDVVIFDEADKAQQDLDMSGVTQLQLSGYANSFHREVQRSTLEMFARGSNAVLRDPDLVQVAMDTAEFEKLNISLISAIHRLEGDDRKRLAGLLLTPLRLIGDRLSPRRSSGLRSNAEFLDLNARAKDALCFLWESAALRAFQGREERSPEGSAQGEEWSRVAQALHHPLEALQGDLAQLTEAMSAWLNATGQRRRVELEGFIAELLGKYTRSLEAGELRMLVQLLVAVTFTVLSYRKLAPRLQSLIENGSLNPIHAERRCSEALLADTPENLLGSLSGVRFFVSAPGSTTARSDGGDVQLQYVVFSGAPRALLYHLHEWSFDDQSRPKGPAVLLTSATSYMPASPGFHIGVVPSYLLRRPDMAELRPSRYEFRPLVDRDETDGRTLRFSGERSESARFRALEKMVVTLLEGGPRDSALARDCRTFDVQHGIHRKAALVVNSYDQCRHLKRFIDANLRAWQNRTVAVVDVIPAGSGDGYVTAGRVEALGDADNWDLLIFPIGALGRGVNIVFTSGPRVRDATLGTLYFLTRPHPSPEDLGLLAGIAAAETQKFSEGARAADDLDGAMAALDQAKKALYKKVGRLLRHPLYARGLGDLFEPFTANIAVGLLQTIGRAMRNGCPAQCIFIDRSWAERSARGEADDSTSSMLVQLRMLIEVGLASDDPRTAALFDALYRPYIDPLRSIHGLKTEDSSTSSPEDEGGYGEMPVLTADDMPA